MEHTQPPEDRPTADDLLSKGFWRRTRSKQTSARSSAPNLNLFNSTYSINNQTNEVSEPAPTQPRRKSWPPPPSCEDEAIALSKEHMGDGCAPIDSGRDDPPCRGIIDQHPVIIESELTLQEAATLQRESHVQDSGERRFVLVSQPGESPRPRVEENAKGYKPDLGPEEAVPVRRASRGDEPKCKVPSPSFERRKSSRPDLPSIQTQLAPEKPAFRRTASAYTFDSPKREPLSRARAPSADYLLSPEVAHVNKGQGKGFADRSSPLQQASKGHVDQLATPVVESRLSGGHSSATSRPTTPVSDKRYSAGADYGRPDYKAKARKPQEQLHENGIHGYTRHTFPDREDLAHASKNSSTQFKGRYYLSSDEELEDSSDSDQDYRQRRLPNSYSRSRCNGHFNGNTNTIHRTTPKMAMDHFGLGLRSHHSSTLPSPNVSLNQLPPLSMKDTARYDSFPIVREDQRPISQPVSVQTPRSSSPRSANSLGVSNELHSMRLSSRRSSPTGAEKSKPGGLTIPPLPVPFSNVTGIPHSSHSQYAPSIPEHDHNVIQRPASARPPENKQSSWQPPQFNPHGSEASPSDAPMGSYRRHSQDVQDGTVAPLPICPRRIPVTGYIDWLTLPHCPGFNICPSCFTSTIMPTEFGSHFVSAAPRSPKEPIVCDFGSQPWYRIAWLLALKERRKELSIIYRIAEVLATSSPCLGKKEAVRLWYSVRDPKTGMDVLEFDVCSTCVKCIETLLPPLRNLFVKVDNDRPDLARVCDMRFDSKRFVHYFDALETMADSARIHRCLDSQAFVDLTKRYASIPECLRDTEQDNMRWFMITQLPEFTVCEECFDEVVRPELEKRKAIAVMFTKSRHAVPLASCQLYSNRMREIFRRAVRSDDYRFLATKARERKAREMEFRRAVFEQKRLRSRNPKGVALELEMIKARWANWE